VPFDAGDTGTFADPHDTNPARDSSTTPLTSGLGLIYLICLRRISWKGPDRAPWRFGHRRDLEEIAGMLLSLFLVCVISLSAATILLLALGHRTPIASRLLGAIVGAAIAL